MIEVQNLSAGYNRIPVLNNVSFTARPGEITTIVGCNGCGKSTLLKAVCGLLPLRGGTVAINGVPVNGLSVSERAKLTAYLAQGKNTPDITAGRMVLHGRFAYLSYPRKYRKSDYEIADVAMARLGVSQYADTPMAELSGGTRQKVYIAMALAQHAPVLIMDEPTSYLDIGQQVKFAEIAAELAREGKTLILVLHDLLLALKISDSICVMGSGRVLMQDCADAVLHSGILPKLYGVQIRTVQTAGGEQYYYQM